MRASTFIVLTKILRTVLVPLLIGITGGLSGCGGGGGGGGGGAPPVAPLLRGGLFTVSQFHADKSGAVWEPESATFACDIDWVDTIAIDSDLDGDYSDESVDYTCEADGTLCVDGDSIGIFSSDDSALCVSFADAPDSVSLSMGLREGSGMVTDDFDGQFLILKFAHNRATGFAHTYASLSTTTGHGLGVFEIGSTSDPGVPVHVPLPFSFSVEDNGRISFPDSKEMGLLRSDGNLFIAANTDDTDDISSFMIGMSLSSGMTTASLQGEYVANMIGFSIARNELWSARLTATFDGVGVARYEFLAHSSGSGGLSGYLAYHVEDMGGMIVAVSLSSPLEVGAVSPDGELFALADTDPSDGEIYILVGIKKHP